MEWITYSYVWHAEGPKEENEEKKTKTVTLLKRNDF